MATETTREITLEYIRTQREILDNLESEILNATENEVADTLYDRDNLNHEIIFYFESLSKAAAVLSYTKSRILDFGAAALSDILIDKIGIDNVSSKEKNTVWNDASKFHVQLRRCRYELHCPDYILCETEVMFDDEHTGRYDWKEDK